jgi:hypothetical protein
MEHRVKLNVVSIEHVLEMNGVMISDFLYAHLEDVHVTQQLILMVTKEHIHKN